MKSGKKGCAGGGSVCFGHMDRLKAYPVSSSVFMELSDGSVWDRSLIVVRLVKDLILSLAKDERST